MEEKNGENQRLRKQLEEQYEKIERLRDEKYSAILSGVKADIERLKSAVAEIQAANNANEIELARLGGERTVFWKAIPFIALIVSIAVAILKLIEALN